MCTSLCSVILLCLTRLLLESLSVWDHINAMQQKMCVGCGFFFGGETFPLAVFAIVVGCNKNWSTYEATVLTCPQDMALWCHSIRSLEGTHDVIVRKARMIVICSRSFETHSCLTSCALYNVCVCQGIAGRGGGVKCPVVIVTVFQLCSLLLASLCNLCIPRWW